MRCTLLPPFVEHVYSKQCSKNSKSAECYRRQAQLHFYKRVIRWPPRDELLADSPLAARLWRQMKAVSVVITRWRATRRTAPATPREEGGSWTCRTSAWRLKRSRKTWRGVLKMLKLCWWITTDWMCFRKWSTGELHSVPIPNCEQFDL